MKSILENRPALAREVNRCAEVAGYLWQKGWAERNGGNITINITEWIRSLPKQLHIIEINVERISLHEIFVAIATETYEEQESVFYE